LSKELLKTWCEAKNAHLANERNFLFAGTHDECNRRLSNHRDFKPKALSETPQTSTASSDGVQERNELESSDAADDYADYDEIILKDSS
jgi:hypothetical protein